MTFFQIVIGLVFLLGGAEYLVKGSVAVARRFGIPSLVIGLTLVGFGTSTPELVASVNAALHGFSAIAVGSIVGSNITNLLLVVGLCAVISPVATTKAAFRRDGVVLIAAAVLILAFVLWGTIERWMGIGAVVLLAAYTFHTMTREQRGASPDAVRLHKDEAAVATEKIMPLWRAAALVLGGLVAVLVGAHLLVHGAEAFARSVGLSQAVIGLTLVAIGTSLPEMATAVMAVIRRHGDVAFGNLVGSCIFNMLGILGLTAIVTPLRVPPEIFRFDIWIMVATIVLFVTFATTGWRIRRWEGGVLLAAYAGYLFAQFSPAARASLGL